MKLSAYAFKRFWSVHAWAGVVTSLVVYVMFVLGSLVLFYRQLTVWEEPLMQRPPIRLESLGEPLSLARPLPEEFYYYLPNAERALPKVGYFLAGTTQWRMWWLDSEVGKLIPQRELAAAYLYDLHYLWHEVTGYWLQYGAGVLVFGFLLAVVTGVLIHLKDLVAQFYQFRPRQTQRVLWSDLHKVTGVFGLPFQLVYALTGTLMALSPLVFQLAVGPIFGGDERQAVETAGALVDDPPPRDYGAASRPLPLDVLTQRALAAEPRLEPESFVFRGFEREQGTVDVRGPIRGQPFGEGLVRVRASDGAVERIETPDRETAVGGVARWIHGLHTVEYGGFSARILIFVLAISGCVAILTGNWVWLARRQSRTPGFGNVLLARLTAGVGAGTPVAVAALLLGSRILPLEWAGRTKAEELILASAFLASVVYALISKRTASTWWRLLATSGLLLLAVPLAARHHSQVGLLGAGPHQAVVVGVEVALLGVAITLIVGAVLMRGLMLQSPSSGVEEPFTAVGHD
ncbi:MAG: PepSY-associated TM helix domain-containing protein [Polyangiaceae bacterium]